MATIPAVLAIIAGVLISVGVIWNKGVKPIANLIKRGHDLIDKVENFDERLTTIEMNSRQLTNNGGSHMKDAVDRIEATLNREVIEIYKTIATQKAA